MGFAGDGDAGEAAAHSGGKRTASTDHTPPVPRSAEARNDFTRGIRQSDERHRMTSTLARSGAAIGGSVGVTVAVIAVGLLIFAVVSLRRRSRGDK